MSKILTQNLSFQGHLSTFEAQNTPKSRHYEAENKAQTLPKQVLNNFEKVQNSTFLTPKMVKIDPSNRPKWPKFGLKISIFEVYYRPFELKINT